MSQLGQTETSVRRLGLSGLPSIADIVGPDAQVRLVPTAEMRARQNGLANLLIRQHAKEANAGD